MSRIKKTEVITITKETSVDDNENAKWLMAHLNAMAERQKNRVETVELDREKDLLNKTLGIS